MIKIEWWGGWYEGEVNADGEPHGKGNRKRYLHEAGGKAPMKVSSGTDAMHGKGTFTMPDGTCCEGEFKNDRLDGTGTFTRPDGTRFEGEFKNDKLHGAGTFTMPDGTHFEFEGEFKNDKLHGTGIFTRSDGTRFEGEFKNGKLHPLWAASPPAYRPKAPTAL